MLLDDSVELENYVMKSKDKLVYKCSYMGPLNADTLGASEKCPD